MHYPGRILNAYNVELDLLSDILITFEMDAVLEAFDEGDLVLGFQEVRHKDEEKGKEKGKDKGKDKDKEVESTRKWLHDSIKIESGDESKDKVNMSSNKSINDDNESKSDKESDAESSDSDEDKQKKKKKKFQLVLTTYENIINNKLMCTYNCFAPIEKGMVKYNRKTNNIFANIFHFDYVMYKVT
jgi:hypothetical protein